MIDTPILRHLIQAGKANGLAAKGVPGGFILVLREGLEEHVLEAQRGHARKFRRLEAVATYLRKLGAREFTVDLEQWAPQSLNL